MKNFGVVVLIWLIMPSALAQSSARLRRYFNPCANELVQDPKLYKILLKRLRLRPARPVDFETLNELFRDWDVKRLFLLNTEWDDRRTAKYFPDLERGPHSDYSTRVGDVRRFRFVIEHRPSRKMVGVGMIQQTTDRAKWQFGYAILKDHRRHGYASETLNGLLQFIRETQPHARIEMSLMSSNFASREILRRAGFVERAIDSAHTEYSLEF